MSWLTQSESAEASQHESKVRQEVSSWKAS